MTDIDHPAPSAPVNGDVSFLCSFNTTGIGRHSEQAFFSLVRQRRPGTVPYYVDALRQTPLQQFASTARNSQGTSLLFWRWPVESMRALPGRKIGWLFFESEVLAPAWVAQLRCFDELWMPSDWARDVLLAHGLPSGRIRVIPSGIDAELHAPRRQPHEPFVFLTVGKYEKRKSIDESIEAFTAGFPRERHPDVEFWIKADHPNFPERVARLRERNAGDARLRFLSGQLRDEDMAALYQQADAFVFPTKAEGFGLPCLEALACGLPVITTCCSAQQVFLQHVQGLYQPVDFDMAPIEDADYAHFYAADYQGTPFGSWAIPRMDSLRAALRTVYEDRESWNRRALEASAVIRERFSWDGIGRTMAEALAG